MSEAPPVPLTRRAALGLAAAVPLALLAGCRPRTPPPAGIEVALSGLPEGRRVRVMRGEEPVEILRTGAAVRARSLWCTHLGCEVRWDEATKVYNCPCHEARFDADGRVLAGPPSRGLREVAVRVEGGRLVMPPPPSAGGDGGGGT